MTRLSGLNQISPGVSQVNVVRGLGATEQGGVANALQSIGAALGQADAANQRILEADQRIQYERQIVQQDAALREQAANADPAESEAIYRNGMAEMGETLNGIENQRVHSAVMGAFSRQSTAGGLSVRQQALTRAKTRARASLLSTIDELEDQIAISTPDDQVKVAGEIDVMLSQAIEDGIFDESEIPEVRAAIQDDIQEKRRQATLGGLDRMEFEVQQTAAVAETGHQIQKGLDEYEEATKTALEAKLITPREAATRKQTSVLRAQSEIDKRTRQAASRVSTALDAWNINAASSAYLEYWQSELWIEDAPGSKRDFTQTSKGLLGSIRAREATMPPAERYLNAMRTGGPLAGDAKIQNDAFELAFSRGIDPVWFTAKNLAEGGVFPDRMRSAWKSGITEGSEGSIQTASTQMQQLLLSGHAEVAYREAKDLGTLGLMALVAGPDDVRALASAEAKTIAEMSQSHLVGTDDVDAIDTIDMAESKFGGAVALNPTQLRTMEAQYHLEYLRGAAGPEGPTTKEGRAALAESAMRRALGVLSISHTRVGGRLVPNEMNPAAMSAAMGQRTVSLPSINMFGLPSIERRVLPFTGVDTDWRTDAPIRGGEGSDLFFIPRIDQDDPRSGVQEWMRWNGESATVVGDAGEKSFLNAQWAKKDYSAKELLNQEISNHFGVEAALLEHDTQTRLISGMANARVRAMGLDDPASAEYREMWERFVAEIARKHGWNRIEPTE